MKYQFANYNIGYPLYGAKFLNDSVLLVTGGGGHKNPDIPNKLTALRIDFNKKRVIKRFREITFDPKDDCPTTLDAAKVVNQDPLHNIILVGCNEDESLVPNHHLRKFAYENDHLKFMASADFNRSNDPKEFTKFSSLSSDGSVGAIASSKLPTVIRIIDPMTMEEKYEIETGSEVKDLHFSPDGKVICYITATTLEVISIVTGRFIVRKTDFNKNVTLSKVRFLSNDIVVVVGSLNQKSKKIIVSKINIKTKNTTVLSSKSISSNHTGVTAMDASADGQLICLATNDKSLLILKGKDLNVIRSFKNVHQGDITAVVFSPDLQYVASVSLTDSVYLVKLPQGLAETTSFLSKLFKLLLNILFTIGIIMVAYLAYYFELHHKTYRYVNEKYLIKRDTSGYFQMHDGLLTTSMDIVDDIVTIHTLTGHVNTESGFDTRKWLTNTAITTISTGDELLDDKVNHILTSNSVVSSKTFKEEILTSEVISSLSSTEASTPVTEYNKKTTMTSLYDTIGSASSSASTTAEMASMKSSIPISLREGLQSSKSSVPETYIGSSNSAPSSVSHRSQEVQPSQTTNANNRSNIIGSMVINQDENVVSKHELVSKKTSQDTLQSRASTLSEERQQISSTLTLKTDSKAIRESSSLVKHTITVDGIVYEVVSMSPAPTTSSDRSSSSKSSATVSSEVSRTDDLISKNGSEATITTTTKLVSTTVPDFTSTSKVNDYSSSTSETTSPLTYDSSLEESTSSPPITKSSTTSAVTYVNTVMSNDFEKDGNSAINSENKLLSSSATTDTTTVNILTKISTPKEKINASVSSSSSFFSSDTTATFVKKPKSSLSDSTIQSSTGVGTIEESNIVSKSIVSAGKSIVSENSSSLGNKDSTTEEGSASSILTTFPFDNIDSTKLNNDVTMMIKTESYSHSNDSITYLAENTTIETSPINKNDAQRNNSSFSKLEVSLNNDLSSSISLTSQMEMPTSSIRTYSSMVPEHESTDIELGNSSVDITALSSEAISEITSSISHIIESNETAVNTVNSYTISNVTSIVSSVGASVSSNLVMEQQSDTVVKNTEEVEHKVMTASTGKKIDVSSSAPSISNNIITNKTSDPQLLYPHHDEL